MNREDSLVGLQKVRWRIPVRSLIQCCGTVAIFCGSAPTFEKLQFRFRLCIIISTVFKKHFGKSLALIHGKLFARKKLIPTFYQIYCKMSIKIFLMKVIKYTSLYCDCDSIFLRFQFRYGKKLRFWFHNTRFLRFRFPNTALIWHGFTDMKNKRSSHGNTIFRIQLGVCKTGRAMIPVLHRVRMTGREARQVMIYIPAESGLSWPTVRRWGSRQPDWWGRGSGQHPQVPYNVGSGHTVQKLSTGDKNHVNYPDTRIPRPE